MPDTAVRMMRDEDITETLGMIHALAVHHGDVATVTEQELRRDALGNAPWIRVLVAEQATLVGYAVLCPLTQLQFGVRGMDMHHLFVVPASRGSGVGRALIAASLAQAKAEGCRYVTVGTHPQNAAAAQVYRAAGFEDLPPPGPRFRMKW